MYIIKNYKTFKGHEGEPCAQGTLHGPKGKVADWSDDSWGGSMRIDFTNKTEETRFAEWAKTYLPAFKNYNGEYYKPETMEKYDLVETAMAQLSYSFAQDKVEAAQAKKGIAYFQTRAAAEKGVDLYTWKVGYTAENVARLRKDYPDVVIINEKLNMPLVDANAYAEAEKEKRIKKLCAKYTIFSVRNIAGQVKDLQIKIPYNPQVGTSLRAKHGKDLVEIYNERY